MIKIRGQDGWGAGHYGAPRKRGNKSYPHEGIDILPNGDLGEVYAFEEGKVTKIGRPYIKGLGDKSDLRYIEIIVSDHFKHRYFYVDGCVEPGDRVKKGQIIGVTQGLLHIFPGITDHYHFEVMLPGGWKEPKVDPVPVLEKLGYEFEG